AQLDGGAVASARGSTSTPATAPPSSCAAWTRFAGVEVEPLAEALAPDTVDALVDRHVIEATGAATRSVFVAYSPHKRTHFGRAGPTSRRTPNRQPERPAAKAPARQAPPAGAAPRGSQPSAPE